MDVLRGRDERDLEAEAYLNQYPQLRPVLAELRRRVADLFGQTELRLEMFTDPEDGNDSGKLFALIPTTLSASDACPLLDRLDGDWWLSQPTEIHRLMSVDVRYVTEPQLSDAPAARDLVKDLESE